MSSNRIVVGLCIALIVVGAGFAVGVILLSKKIGQTNPIAKPVATSRPAATAPAKAPEALSHRVIPALLSPDASSLGKSSDPRVNDLILAHNARLERIASVRLEGKCTWFSSPKPRDLRMTFDLTNDTGELTCGPNGCTLDASTVILKANSAMQVDALYWLMFRRFDPAKFKSPTEDPIDRDGVKMPAVMLESESETVYFDPATGRPLKLLVKMEAGLVLVDYTYDPAGDPKSSPTSILIHLPPAWFGFDIGTEIPRIRLDVDPKSLQIVPRMDQ